MACEKLGIGGQPLAFDSKSVRYLKILTQTPPLDAFHFPRSLFPRWPRIHKGT
jgi:hypothetical protein